MTVDVDIVTQNRQHVLVVPNDAIRRDDADKPYVLVVVDRSTVKRSVQLGTTGDTQAIVRSGVKPGDTVVAERNVGIVAGIHVTPTMMPTVTPSAKP
jgi:multidrug efflux pump subunit AcrA (membrane-fusion protein)